MSKNYTAENGHVIKVQIMQIIRNEIEKSFNILLDIHIFIHQINNQMHLLRQNLSVVMLHGIHSSRH